MAKVIVTEGHLEDIASAIRTKNGSTDTYRPGDMAAAIQALDTSGIHPTGTKQIAENGTYDVTDYASANVNVPNSYSASDEGKVVDNGALVAQTSRNVTANGTYDTTTNDEVVVNVPSSQPNLQSKTVTENGTVTPDQGYDGLSSVVVNVSGGGGQSYFERLTEAHKDLGGGYVDTSSGTWTVDAGTNAKTDVYELVAGKTYIIMLGANYGNRFSVGFYASDPALSSSNLSGTRVNDYNPASPYAYGIACRINELKAFTPSSNGYLAIQKTNAGITGIPSYAFEIKF